MPNRIDRSFAYFVLGRATCGPNAQSVAQLCDTGLAAWLDEQLKPNANQDRELSVRLAAARLRIKYPAGEGFAALDEERALTTLDAPVSALWHLTNHAVPAHALERRRPRDEVLAATLLRAVHSQFQLREVMCNFWHDHFNVDAVANETIGIALPAYDRDVIRVHALGNFREFLESVARSTAMQYYLSNRSSRAGAANENYARELFELHTLGRDAYLNDQYDRWREVPGALRGAPQGYIDQDVYEAARAFTGWTIEDGSGVDAHRKLPLTGQFTYVEGWHDGYQKRVLATEFDAFAPALADGRRVLDLLAAHPATARFVCAKLCRRFIAETVPASLHQRLCTLWLAEVESHDQIAQVLRALLLSPEFARAQHAQARKVRRPLQLAAGFARALEIDLTYAEPLAAEISQAGQPLFGWPTPTGLPDTAAPLLASQSLRHRWALLLSLAENSWKTGALGAPAAYGLREATTAGALDALLTRLNGAPQVGTANAILEGCGWPADQRLDVAGVDEAARRLARLAAFAGMSLEFQCV